MAATDYIGREGALAQILTQIEARPLADRAYELAIIASFSKLNKKSYIAAGADRRSKEVVDTGLKAEVAGNFSKFIATAIKEGRKGEEMWQFVVKRMRELCHWLDTDEEPDEGLGDIGL